MLCWEQGKGALQVSRVSKEPAERRQEILDTAIELFYKKGFARTSIADIARQAGISQGLCYRYFPSKEAIADAAIDRYAQMLLDKTTPILCDPHRTLREKLQDTPNLLETETDDNYYYKLAHAAGNAAIHDRVSARLSALLVPLVQKQIELANERGETQIDDPETAAAFCVYGQRGVFLRTDLSGAEKVRRIAAFLTQLLDAK